MTPQYEIRLIQPSDAQAVLDIYAPYVLSTYITFDYEVPTFEEFSKKIGTTTAEYPWLVCLQDGKIVGYAYGSRHRYKTAYNWSPESTIYIAEAAQGQGIGRAMYGTLFEILRMQGYVNVYAGIGMPNERSEKLHLSFGFEELGIFKKIGYKLGKWHDTKWFQLHLLPHSTAPLLPRPMPETETMNEFHAILKRANERMNGIGTLYR